MSDSVPTTAEQIAWLVEEMVEARHVASLENENYDEAILNRNLAKRLEKMSIPNHIRPDHVWSAQDVDLTVHQWKREDAALDALIVLCHSDNFENDCQRVDEIMDAKSDHRVIGQDEREFPQHVRDEMAEARRRLLEED